MKIAITGGIGSGKTTVIRYLKDQLKDYVFYSVDEAVAESYSDDRIKDFMRVNGINNKQELSDLAFREPFVKAALERVANPIIMEKIEKWLELTNVVVEFPLLYERGDPKRFDFVISVSATVAVRTKRVQLRTGFTESKVKSIISQQMDQKQKDSMADLVFQNSADVGDLTTAIEALTQKIRAKEAEKAKPLQILETLRSRRVSSMKVGIVSGSFDPLTLGHLYVIQKALHIVDELRIVVSQSASKASYFTLDERAKLIKESLAEVVGSIEKKIHLDILPNRNMLITHAKNKGASLIFRGLRTVTDLEYEKTINSVQRDVDPGIETVYIFPPDELSKVSSSLVKELNGYFDTEKLIAKYTTKTVQEALELKREAKRISTEMQ